MLRSIFLFEMGDVCFTKFVWGCHNIHSSSGDVILQWRILARYSIKLRSVIIIHFLHSRYFCNHLIKLPTKLVSQTRFLKFFSPKLLIHHSESRWLATPKLGGEYKPNGSGDRHWVLSRWLQTQICGFKPKVVSPRTQSFPPPKTAYTKSSFPKGPIMGETHP